MHMIYRSVSNIHMWVLTECVGNLHIIFMQAHKYPLPDIENAHITLGLPANIYDRFSGTLYAHEYLYEPQTQTMFK